MKTKYLSIPLCAVIMTGCASAPEQPQTTQSETSEEEYPWPTEPWMTEEEKELAHVFPYPEFDAPEGWHWITSESGPHIPQFDHIDNVFQDNVTDTIIQIIEDHRDGRFTADAEDKLYRWCQTYTESIENVGTEKSPIYRRPNPHYIVRLFINNEDYYELKVSQFKDPEDGMLTLTVGMGPYETYPNMWLPFLRPFFPEEVKTEEMENYFFHIEDHFEDKSLSFTEEFPEIYGTKTFHIDNSGDRDIGSCYYMEFKTQSSDLYDEIKDADYEIH